MNLVPNNFLLIKILSIEIWNIKFCYFNIP